MEKEDYMRIAIEQARKGFSHAHGGPFGCVIVKDNKIIAKGHNHVLKNNDPTAHGEMVTIRKASKKLKTYDLKGCELYTTGFPCPMCLGAILWANISKVYYGCTTDDAEIIGFRDKSFEDNMKQIIEELCSQLLEKECQDLFKEYDSVKDKKLY